MKDRIIKYSILFSVLILLIVTIVGCNSKSVVQNSNGDSEYSSEVENSSMEIPKGYDFQVQVIADNRMIIRLTDPNLQEKYPTFVKSNEEYSYNVASWNINLGNHWNISTVIPSNENTDKNSVSVSDGDYVQTMVSYYDENSQNLNINLPSPKIYIDGKNIIYDINIPDDCPIGFSENMDAFINIENIDTNDTTNFQVNGEDAKADTQLISENISNDISTEKSNKIFITPISSKIAIIYFDYTDAKKNKDGDIQYRADLTFDEFVITNYQKISKDGTVSDYSANISTSTQEQLSYIEPENYEKDGKWFSIIDISPYESTVDFLEPGNSQFLFVEVASAVDYNEDNSGEYTDNLTISLNDVIEEQYSGLNLQEIKNSLSDDILYAQESSFGNRSGRYSLYVNGFTQEETDELYFNPETDDVLMYKGPFIDKKYLQNTQDPDAGIAYYMAWFDSSGNLLGYIEKYVFSTEDNTNNVGVATLDNDTDGGIFHYTVVSLGTGKEEKPYQICYRICDGQGSSGYDYVLKKGISSKDDFIKYFQNLEEVTPPKSIKATEKSYLKNSIIDTSQSEELTFATYPMDYLYFVPTTKDFLLVEDYDLEMENTFDSELMMSYYGTNKIKYDLSVLRSYDKDGNEVAKIKRYVFEYSDMYYDSGPGGRWYQQGYEQSDARDCFLAHNNDGQEYELLKQVDNVVYIIEKNSSEEESSKEKLIDSYGKKGYKYYASVPLKQSEDMDVEKVSSMISTGKVQDYDFSKDFDYKFEVKDAHTATITLVDPFISDTYTINYNGVMDGTYEYYWDIGMNTVDGERMGVSTYWYNEQLGYSIYPDNATLTIGDMSSTWYYNKTDGSDVTYDNTTGCISCEVVDNKIIWTIKLPEDCTEDMTKMEIQNTSVYYNPLNKTGYSFYQENN